MSYGSSSSFPNYGATVGASPSKLSGMALYNQLCDAISSDIFAINNDVTAIDRAYKQLGTKSDNDLLRDKIKQTIHNTSSTASNTHNCLKQLASTVEHDNKQQRLQLDRLQNEFQDTMKRYSTLQSQVHTKMKYTQLMKPQPRPTAANVWAEEDDDEEKSLVKEEQRLQMQRQQEAELEWEQSLFHEREERISQIESDMLGVNQIMKDISAMIYQQGEQINSIEANVESTAGNTSAGVQNLSKASEYQKKYRKKMCFLIVILLIVAMVLALIIYFSIPKS